MHRVGNIVEGGKSEVWETKRNGEKKRTAAGEEKGSGVRGA